MFAQLKRMFLVLLATILLVIPSLQAEPVSLEGPEPVLDHAWRKDEYPQGSFLFIGDPPVYQEVDVTHYTIDASFFLGDSYPSSGYLEAVTTIDGMAKAVTLDELVIDFHDNITINSLKLNDVEFSNYSRYDHRIWMDLSADPLDPAEVFEITVDYTHIYGNIYQGLMFRTHGDSDTPGICSVDQPYMSSGWWPCFDVPGDKATADIYLTFPDWMTAVSNGLLQGEEVDNGDGTKTAHWQENHPLYPDVLMVAMSDYDTWTDTYVSPLDGTPMTLYYYAWPEDAAKAMNDFAVTKDAMEYFAMIYGEYPFIDEKYGIAEGFNSRGSIENQTMTTLSYTATQQEINWDVIVHELAHQWWGDWVTCATFNHLWLHEGFATYSEVLFHENDSGEPAGPFMAVNYDDGLYDGELADTVYVEEEDVWMPFVPSGAVYEKGAWVLHMLRYIMGDASFFDVAKTFGTTYAYSNADTDDFKSIVEAEYGSSLAYFFDQWIYTPYRPIYSVTYETSSREGGYKVDVNLRQTQGHQVQDISETPLRDYYIMPVEFTVHYTDETSQTFSFDNTQRDQSFQILTTKQPDYTVFDEDVNILKVAEEHIADNDGIPGDGDGSGIPGDNPCAGGATEDCDDNCPDLYNPAQEDTYPPGGGNGIGDACECEGNFDCDEDCDGTDAATFKIDFGRSPFFNPCTKGLPCNGDFDCDSDCDGTDAAKFKEDFGRSMFSNPCPTCIVGDWCSYPGG